MPTSIQSCRDSLFALLAAATAATAVLGSVTLIFAEAGRTPTFIAGSDYAAQAVQCPAALTVRRQCLRDIAASAVLAARPAAVVEALASTPSMLH